MEGGEVGVECGCDNGGADNDDDDLPMRMLPSITCSDEAAADNGGCTSGSREFAREIMNSGRRRRLMHTCQVITVGF
jgi:hypothetical protein